MIMIYQEWLVLGVEVLVMLRLTCTQPTTIFVLANDSHYLTQDISLVHSIVVLRHSSPAPRAVTAGVAELITSQQPRHKPLREAVEAFHMVHEQLPSPRRPATEAAS